MGDKKPSTRTLPTGEKVTHYPGGKMVLQPANRLSASLDARREDKEAASGALRDALIEAAAAKHESLGAGDAVPSEKRSV